VESHKLFILKNIPIAVNILRIAVVLKYFFLKASARILVNIDTIHITRKGNADNNPFYKTRNIE